ncbi:outer membrane receptor protein involved in Fe transport [Sphingomonas kyeonggiensis]|uniref:TonB-dependent receptor plug domain-containing protein n=1 Tax=Sphingomonas kyeonggiensis TaxID=1268553 RepID=UPI00277F7BD6|nr:TonB-dependent receptor [Sphingomonas kyeonggiensis]MDQ0252047.1 outer membrane receptor protein involved in Fe transport [Sphingomonas kyeonggiensis]
MIEARAFKKVLASSSAFAAIALAMPAWAQTTAPATQEAPAQAAPAEEGEILVTGSRIRRDGFQNPTPLTVLTQQDIQNTSPTNNIADFVNQLPQLAGSTKPANSRLNLSNGSAGINALNMRNLGEGRVLVLLDGRRSVGSTIYGWVDINTIPQALVDRVEVVTGGASSAYGSDAVSGVVNFILNKKLEGLKIEADTGITTYGDGGNYSASIAGGKSFAGGRGHVLLSANIDHQDGIFEVGNEREWNHTGYVRAENPAWVGSTATTPGTTNNRYFTTLRNVGASNSTPGGLITASAGTTVNALRGLYFGQGGAVNTFDYGTFTFPAFTRAPGSSAPSVTQNGSWQVNDSGTRIGLMPKDDRWGVFGRLSYEVADGIELFAEGSYNKQKVFFNAGPNLSTGITYNTTGCTTVPVPVTCNAFALQALGASRLAGVTSVTVATTAADLPFRAIDNERKVQRYVVGANGDFDAFGKAAHWEVYAQYGRSDVREQLRNIMHNTRMANATAGAFAPAGNARGYTVGSIQCLINVDASTTNDDPNCVPLNRLGVGVADQAAINYVLGNPYRDQVLEQYVAGTNWALTPFATWAGDVSVSIGGEVRKEKIRGTVPKEYQPVITTTGTTNAWSVGNYLPFTGEYSVKEAYLETVVPLGLGLEFNGAVRATDYSNAGYVTTWKLGATWAPIPDIRFRVTRSRDIRAPNLNELYQAGTANSDSVRNPLYSSTNPANGPQTFGYSGLVTGNPNLRPEIANSWNIGAVVSPRFLPGFTASADYFRIDLEGAIDSISAQEIMNRCAEGIAEYCAAISDDPVRSTPAAPYKLIRSQPFNFVRKLVRGIDFDAAYRIPLGGASTFTLKGVATRYIENLSDTGIAGQVAVNTVGTNGGQASTPTWIFRGSATYESETFSATVTGRGVSAGKYSATGIECTTSCPTTSTTSVYQTYDNNQVSGLFYVDLNLTQTVPFGGNKAQFFVNVTNLFNRWPLLLPETGLAANSTYSDMLGRQFRAGIRISLK